MEILAFSIFLAAFSFASPSVIPTQCDYFVSPTLPTSYQVKEEIERSGTISEDGTYVTCNPEYAQCMVLWTFDQYDQNLTEVLLKGCWRGNGDCERKNCIANDNITSRFVNNTRFCCCSSPKCNSNYTYVWMPKDPTRMIGINLTPSKSLARSYTTIAVVGVIALILLAVFATVAVCIFRSWSRSRARLDNQKLLDAAANGQKQQQPYAGTDREQLLKNGSNAWISQPKRLLDPDRLEILEIIGRGRFSTVYKSLYQTTGEYVAVKIYPHSYRQYYANESQIYSWPFMEHENLVRFYGGTELETAALSMTEDPLKSAALLNQMADLPPHHQEVSPQYLIVTAYMPSGTLQDYLKANTMDWEQMCKMGASVAKGLAYLHGMVACGGDPKPSIVHRDMNSRNVLIKPDGMCVLCDFGFAMALEEAKATSSNPQGDTPLTEVGTIRYFAPEILEGAVNLRDPATALKQVDVYALGLVLWEIISRCATVYGQYGNESTEQSVPVYQSPYSKEIDAHPTLEQMQLFVCKRKVRPLFPTSFYKSNSGALRVLRILVEDCWDSDSDARITASCAHERLFNLQSVPNQNVFHADSAAKATPGDLYASRFISYSDLGRSHQYSTNGESTVDTGATSGLGSMCMNSSDRARSVNSSSIGYHTTAIDSPAALQPYQGRNPCMERNLLVESSDDSANAKDRLTESQFQKLDPCNPDTIASFASPALLASIANPQQQRVAVGGKNPEKAVEKSNLALHLMQNENRRMKTIAEQRASSGDQQSQHDGQSEHIKRNVDESVQQLPQPSIHSASMVLVDYRGSNDSGNCTTTGSRSGNSSVDGSPRLRTSADDKPEHHYHRIMPA